MKYKVSGLAMTLDAVAAVCVALIFIGIVAIGGSSIIASSKNDRAMSETASLGALISEYKQETGNYPAKLETLKSKDGQYGPWLKEVPTDPWKPGASYVYKYDANGFAVYSVGKGKKDSSSATKIASGNIGFTGK